MAMADITTSLTIKQAPLVSNNKSLALNSTITNKPANQALITTTKNNNQKHYIKNYILL